MALFIDSHTKEEFFRVATECTQTVLHSSEDFGVVDNKGRAIGARVWIWQETLTESEQSRSLQPVAKGLGVFYCMYPNALRAGQKFGAIASALKFRTEAEREVAIAKYFKGARARALKTAAK